MSLVGVTICEQPLTDPFYISGAKKGGEGGKGGAFALPWPFATTGISPVSPPLPPFFLLIERKIYCQTMTSEKRTDRTDALGLPCARMSMVARVSGKRTNYSAISKNFFHATVQQNRLTLQAEKTKVFENICASVRISPIPCPASISGERHAVRFRALPCDSPRRPRKKGGEGGDSNACNKFGPPPSPPFHAVIQKWGKWIFCRGGGRPEKRGTDVHLLSVPGRGPCFSHFYHFPCTGWDSAEFSGNVP